MAVASMLLGIVWLVGGASVLALIFGYISRAEIDRSNGIIRGRGMATAGIILGWIGIFSSIAWIIFLVVAAHSLNNYNGYTNP